MPKKQGPKRPKGLPRRTGKRAAKIARYYAAVAPERKALHRAKWN